MATCLAGTYLIKTYVPSPRQEQLRRTAAVKTIVQLLRKPRIRDNLADGRVSGRVLLSRRRCSSVLLVKVKVCEAPQVPSKMLMAPFIPQFSI